MPSLLLSASDESCGSEEIFSSDSTLVDAVSPSPNQGERRGFARPDMLILHYTGMPNAAAAVALLRNPASEVSCHYVVEDSGRILQLVPESRRAWHAGVSCWRGERDINSASIGVEICNPGHDGGLPDFPNRQIESVIALCRDVASRFAIRPERILAHSDVAPGRKRDPGENFPWGRLAQAGVGHLAEAAAPDSKPIYARAQEGAPVRGLQSLLSLYGYELELSGVYDSRTEVVVAAFQRHFRPARVDGMADAGTVGVLRRLLAELSPSPLC